jgi:hypothetical protein
MTQQPLSRALPTRLALGTAGMVVLLATAACGTSGSDDGAAGSADKAAPAAEQQVDGPAGRDDVDYGTLRTGVDGADVETASQTGKSAQTVAVISTGSVSLESDDVGDARFEVQKIVGKYRGTISQEETTTGDDGKIETSRMVLRIPSKAFTKVTQELEGVADLLESSSGSEDVTTQVIDNEVRIRAQTKSLERIEALLAQATNLREVVAIESQLTRRQADLDSLKSQQAFLADQTTLSTISVFIERTQEEKDDKDETGFLRCLSAGWGGFVAAMVGLATVLGFLLPFAVVIALLGVPAWITLRNVRRRRPEPEPELSSAGRPARTP